MINIIILLLYLTIHLTMLPAEKPTEDVKDDHKSNKNSQEDVLEKESKYSSQEEPRPWCWYFVSWGIFVLVFIVYAGLWAIDRFAVRVQTSSYYGVSFPVSGYLSNSQTYSSSASIYTSAEIGDSKAVVMHILYTWFMWKLPIMVFLFQMVSDQKDNKLRFIPWIAVFIICLIIDIILIVFAIQSSDGTTWTWNYTDWMAYTGLFLFSLIVVGVGNKGTQLSGNNGDVKSSLLSTVFLLLFIAFMYASYTILLPGLYYVYVQNVPEVSPYLQIYLFPLFDLIFYSILLVGNAHISPKARQFASMLQFFQLGYFVGMNMLAGVTQVQFYYLIAYLAFRNFFVNRVMWDWEDVVNNPACLPGWPLYYYLSMYFNAIPIIGLGRIVISKSFFSMILSTATPILYPLQSSLYPYQNTPPQDDITKYNYNIALEGNVYWVAGIVIWFVSTVTQKYQRNKPSGYTFFYYMIGIYFFYIGLCAALDIGEEGQYAFS